MNWITALNFAMQQAPRIPQYAQSIARGGQKVASKIPQWAQGLQNYMFGQTPQYIANKLTGTKFQPNIKGGVMSNVINPAFSSALVQDP